MKISPKKSLRGILLGFVYLMGTLGIVASGGGGGPTSISYAGNTDPAVITRTNAARLVGNIFIGQSIVGSSSGGAARIDTSIDTSSQGIGLAQFPGRLTRKLRNAMQSSTVVVSRSPTVQVRTNLDETEPCDNPGGSVHITGFIEDNGTGTLTLDYINCREGDETLDGTVAAQINAFDFGFLVLTDAIYSFSVLTLTSPTFNVSLDGSIHSQISLGAQTEQLTVDRLVALNNATGEMIMITNQVSIIDYDNIFSPSSLSETITGRIYDSTHGYVDFTTLASIIFSTITQDYPDGGQLLLTGSLNSGIQVTVISDTHTLLDLDLDGDTTFESAATVSWLELETEPDLADSDHDGIHDSWELANGLDPSDPADAIQDADIDGFSNITEYLAGSDKDDATSLPQIADLLLNTAMSGKALVASTFSYMVKVDNLGPLTATNVTVTDTLPAGANYLSASGSGWACNHVNGIVTCDRGSLSFGSTSTIMITVNFPLSPGSITNIATVSSDTLDTNQANNIDIRETDLVTLAPSLNLELGSFAFDMELDAGQRRLYVSLPHTNSIAIVSLDTFIISDNIFVGSGPYGIALNPNKDTLYVALNNSGAVAALDLDTLSVAQIDVAEELNTFKVEDVIAPTQNDVFVTGWGTGTGALTYIVKIDTAANNQISRVASNIGKNAIRNTFAARNNPQFLYATGLFPNFVYKLDLSQVDAPLILEGLHSGYTLLARNHLAINLDGSKLFLSNGEILSTSTLENLGQVSDGVSTVTSDGAAVLVGEVPNKIGIFDTSSYSKIEQLFSTCNIQEIREVIELEANMEWLLLGQNSICKVTAPDNISPVPPLADLAVNTRVNGDAVSNSGLTYQVEVRNLGPLTATNVTVTDTLPAGANYLSASGSGWACNHVNGIVTCDLGSLAVGAAPPILISIGTSDSGNITNSVGVSSDTPDSDQTNNVNNLVAFVEPRLSSVNLALGTLAFDMEKDISRRQLYVSLPNDNSIAIISLDTLSVINNIFVGTGPHGIAMNPVGDKLYVALKQAGAVAALDLNTLSVTQIDVSSELNTSRVHDVIAPTANDVFVSGDPIFPDIAYIVKIDTGANNQITRVADSIAMSRTPIFRAHPNPQFLFVQQTTHPLSLFKLDLEQSNVPILIEKDLSSTLQSVSLDGSRLFLETGEVLSPDTLNPLGLLINDRGVNALGVSTPSVDGASMLIADKPNSIGIYNISTYLNTDRFFTSCIDPFTYKTVELQFGLEWAILGEDNICLVSNP